MLSKKKKVEVVINNEELKPTVLYTLKEKKVNFFALILLFGLFLSVIYFLPELSEKYQEYKKKSMGIPVVNNHTTSHNKENDNDDDDVNIEEQKYIYSSTLVITNLDFTISGFNFNNNVLNFSITNAKNNNVDLKSKKYFLNIYDENDILVKRIKIAEDVFNAKEKKNYTFNVTSPTISYFILEELTIDDYPSIALDFNDNNEATITCIKDNITIKYTFTKNELTSINEDVNMSNANSNYQNELIKYQTQANNFGNYPGITCNFTNNNTNFVYTMEINLNTATVSNLNNVNYYDKDTPAQVVNFEMESRGYTCS